MRDHLRQAISSALSRSHLGYCAGLNYGMQLGKDMVTPDLLMLTTEQLATNAFHDCYVEIAAHLVIEISLPEQSYLDTHDRCILHERSQIPHYRVVDPVRRQFTF